MERLITDYSTIIYDSAIANIPFICFGFDYETYKDERGFYFDLDEKYPGGVAKLMGIKQQYAIDKLSELGNPGYILTKKEIEHLLKE